MAPRETVLADAPLGEETLVPALEITDLRVSFDTPLGTIRAVDGVSLAVAPGEVLGIVGESGSGKSVLVKSVMQLLPSRNVTIDGDVRVGGIDLSSLDARTLRSYFGPEVAMVFQDALTALNPAMRVGAQIVEQMRAHRKITKKAASQRAVELLSEVGISDPRQRSRQYPHQLSGGMRQRVMIALALSCDPSVMLADEPTTALDVTIQAQIMELLLREQHTRNMAMILITHDLGLASKYTDHLAVMYGGQFVESGPTNVVLSNKRSPYTQALYSASPRMKDPPHTRLQTLPGHPPMVTGEQTGCRFASRCPSAQERCTMSIPPVLSERDGDTVHSYRCFVPLGTPDGDAAFARNRERGESATGVLVR